MEGLVKLSAVALGRATNRERLKMNSHATYRDDHEPRRIGAGLAIGIFLMPVIFAWFLLRTGYTAGARIVAFGWLGLLVAVGVAGSGGSAPAPNAPAVRSPTPTAAPETKWGYGGGADELHGQRAYAIIQSDDSERFKGSVRSSRLTVTLVKAGNQPTVAFQMTKGGTFLCGDGDITVKFDDAVPETLTCHSSGAMNGVVFLDYPGAFIERISASKRMVIEPAYVVDGRKRFHFTTVGLKKPADWN